MRVTDVSTGSFRVLILTFPSADEVPIHITRNSFYITIGQLAKTTICIQKCLNFIKFYCIKLEVVLQNAVIYFFNIKMN